MPNVFATAKAAPVAAKKSAAKPSSRPIPGLEEFAAIDSVMKALKALRETLETEVKFEEQEIFIKDGMAARKRPDNFTAAEGIATASAQLRSRASNIKLSDEEKTLLDEHKIPTRQIDVVADTFIINPAYVNDSALLEKVGTSIGKIKGVPEDFIQKQAGKSHHIVEEGAIDFLFANITDRDTVSLLLKMVGTLSLAPKVSNPEKALDIVRDILFPKKEDAEAA